MCFAMMLLMKMKHNNKKRIMVYDREADALAIYLGKGEEEEFVDIAPNVVGELDKNGALIGVEILNASLVFKALLGSDHQTSKRAPIYAS